MRVGRKSARVRCVGRGARGFVLLVVLVLVALLAMVATSLLFQFRAEESLGSASEEMERAWGAAMSGVAQAIRVAEESQPGFLEWQDRAQVFRDRLVWDDGAEEWRYTVYSTEATDGLAEVRYGMTDEASRIHLNRLEGWDLAKLPGMTAERAAELRSWSVRRAAPSRGGGGGVSAAEELTGMVLEMERAVDGVESTEAGRKLAMATAGRMECVEEVLGMGWMRPWVFFGEDMNWNGRLDSNEDDGGDRLPWDDNDGRLDVGMRGYFTVYSMEPNEAWDGRRRIDINDAQHVIGADDVPEATALCVGALRQHKVRVRHPAELLEATYRIKTGGVDGTAGREIEVPSGVTRQELGRVLDRLTGSRDAELVGLVNVNTASLEVLKAMAGVEESLAEAIVSARRSVGPERRSSLAWLVQEEVMSAERFKQLAPRLTVRSEQFRFHVVGYGRRTGRYRHFEVVIERGDGKGRRGRVVFLRELTRLGRPLPMGLEGGEPGGQGETGPGSRGSAGGR